VVHAAVGLRGVRVSGSIPVHRLQPGTLASRIGRQIPWEFDYKYDTHQDAQFGSPFPPPRTE